MVAVIEEKPLRGWRELGLLVCWVCAAFLLLALTTFNIEDPGWSHSGSEHTIHNACGFVGAWLSDFIFSFFGILAYLFPLMIFMHGYFYYVREYRPKGALLARWTGFVTTQVAGVSLLDLHIPRLPIVLPESGTGGILGAELGRFLEFGLGVSGATLVVLAVLLVGFTLFTGLSWWHLMALVGRGTMTGCGLFPPKDDSSDTLSPKQARDSASKTERKNKPEIKMPPEEPAKAAKKSQPNRSKPDADALEPHRKGNAQAETPLTYLDALPELDLLEQRENKVKKYTKTELEEISRKVEDVLLDYNITVDVEAVYPGPVITRFELRLAPGIKVSRISGLAKDLARGLSVTSVRIVEIIQGKSVIGLEIPNQEREIVALRDLLASEEFERAKSKLTIAMGKDIAGVPIVADLSKMPHVLVAGTTGSGKSVAINTMILSLLYKAKPADVRLIMIDPKMLELSVYEGIPHLLTPVVTDMKDAQNALRWAVGEMERRYGLMSKVGVRNLAGYNQLVREAAENGKAIKDPTVKAELGQQQEPVVLTVLPSIVIVIDELADMMMVVGKKVEELIARLAQKARAAGIHLVLATQRPSVDVLTGLIKANIPTRISFQVSSRIDSRTVIDQGGAETLLGNGDMLFLPSGTSIPIRAHGGFVDDSEVHRVVEFLKLTGPTNYLEDVTQEHNENGQPASLSEAGSETDPLYDEAVLFVTDSRKASISSVQRRFKIGYNRAARIIEDMEIAGIVSPAEHTGARTVLAPPPH